MDALADSERAPHRPLTGWSGRLASLLSAALAAYALYWTLFIVQPQIYRVSFLLIALIVIFLIVPSRTGARGTRVPVYDWILCGLTIVVFGWPLVDFARFVYRAAEPSAVDLALGSLAIAVVLEATRRAVGWILPLTATAFLIYAWCGPLLDRVGLGLVAHRGYGLDRLIGTLYMSLEGIFGVPLDVAATYIILFTIYGAVLEASGAARFFLDWALSASGRTAAAPGRSVVLAGFLLGTVSGSGVATTVMLGSVAWPILRRAGYTADTAGAVLSASGIGALLSPPTLGAAAFLLAELLQISYLQVLAMALVPTLLYYLSILIMVTGENGKGASPLFLRPPGRLHYHFLSIGAMAALLLTGMSAFRAVVWATGLAVVLSYRRADTRLTPTRLFDALARGGRDVIGIAATTATAGIIVGVVTLTGLGLKISGLIVALAGGTLALTVLYSALAVWLLGLAVPVTAAYVIAAVMIAPALTTAGVPDFAAHMFIFYYAVLSEVSPPTALSPFAAAALTGGNPFKTMILTWKYTLPAFVVPLVFTLTPHGAGVLLRGTAPAIAAATLTATAGIALLAVACGGRLRRRLGAMERVLIGGAGTLMLYGSLASVLAGALALALVFVLQSAGRRPLTESGRGR